MTTQRTNQVTINSVTYHLYQPNGTGPRAFQLERVPYDPQAAQPFVVVLPFGGGGIGPTLGGGLNQFNYGYDTDARVQGQLGPGPKISTLALTGAGTITKIVTTRDASANMYVYVVNDSAKLFKVKFSDLSTTYTTTFAHAASPQLTDLVVIKDGSAPGVSDRGVTQPTGAFLLAMFGETAPLQYTNAIANAAADTWAGAVADAYGGVGAAMQGPTNTSVYVYKSTGASGQSTGAFSRLQYTQVTTSTVDLSSTAQWSPATPYQAGDFGSSITRIIEYQRGPLVCKPEGLFLFDQNYNNTTLTSFKSYIHSDNGKHTAVWGRRLIAPTRYDLLDVSSGAVGLKTITGNTSALAGTYPTAFTIHGDDAYAAYYDGTDTHVVMLRPRRGENVPQEFLIFPITRFAGAVCRALTVATNAAGVTYLLGGKGSSLFYCVIDPVASRTYEDAGIHETAVWGAPDKPFRLEKLTVFASGVGSGKSWQIAANLDEGGYNNVGAAVTTNGVNSRTLTPGTNDTGSLLQLKFTCTNSTNTNNPVLKGGNPERSGSGVIMKGAYVGDTFTRYTMRLHLGTDTNSGISNDEIAQKDALIALVETATNVAYADYWAGNKKLLIESVKTIEGDGSATQAGERYIEVVARELAGS